MNTLRYIATLFFLWASLPLFSQLPSSPTVFSPETGHPTKYATSIAEDKNGLIWLSTRSGLYRFDGETFSPIDEVEGDLESLTGTDIRYMEYLPESHELWILPFQADYLLVFQIETFQIRKLPLPSVEGGRKEHAALKKDIRGNLMVSIFTGTSHHIFKVSPPNKFYDFFSFASHFRFFSMDGFDDKGQLYITSSRFEGILKLGADGQQVKSIVLDSIIARNGNGKIFYNYNPYIGSKKIYHWLHGQQKIVTSDFNNDNYTVLSDLSRHPIDGLGRIKFIDKEENLWFTYYTSDMEIRLLRISASGESMDFSPVLQQAKLKYDAISIIMEDSSRNIWVVTNQGLIRFTNLQNLFEHYLSTNQIAYFSSPRSMVTDEHGNLYCNAREVHPATHRIHKIKQGEQEPTVLFPNMIPSVESNLPVWFSVLKIDTTLHTIWYLVQDRRLVAYRYLDQELEEFQIRDLKKTFNDIPGFCQLPDNNLIFGSHLGELIYFNTTTHEQKRLPIQFPKDKQYVPVKNIINGSDGNVWIVAGGELHQVNLLENTVQHISEKRLGFKLEVEVLVDEDGIVWANAQNGGLGRFDPSTGASIIYSEADGLSNDNIASIVPHGDKLYIGTFNGLSIFDKNTEHFQTYSTSDGLLHNEFNYFSKLKTSDGKIYLGGLDGVNAFYPDSLNAQDLAPPLQWIEFSSYDDQLDSLIIKNHDFQNFSNIYIPPTRTYFELSWLLPEYTQPSHNQYFTWLEGFEKDWQYRASKNKLKYNSLPAGDYTLHIKGTNPMGAPSEKDLQLNIKVGQYFYQSNWFLLAVIFAIAGLIYFAVRYQFQQRLKLERMRSTIASDLHDEVGSSLTHLSMLIGAVEENGASEISKKYLKKGNEILTGAISKIRDVVWAIDSRNDKSGNLIDRMEDFAFDMLRSKNINYSFETTGINRNYILPPLLRQNIYLIYKEAIHNIVKHSNANQVQIDFSKNGQRIYLKIKDNGRDLNGKKIKGQGLSNMKLRAKRVGGKVEIENKEEGFNVFFETDVLGS